MALVGWIQDLLLTPRYYLKIKKNEKGIFDLYIDGKKQTGITKPLQ